jgi:very-short-patch-repair endonuclease
MMFAPVSRARQLRNKLTDAEKALWQRLRDKQLSGFRFRRQAPVGDYIVDFACFNPRLVIELDGGQHAQTAQQKHDTARTEFLESQGFRVVRFWNNDALQNTDGVVMEIISVLEELSSE